MKLAKLLTALSLYQTNATDHELANLSITKITADSRQVEPNTLFIAYHGISVDSHQFIPQAIANGASAVVGEESGGSNFGLANGTNPKSKIQNPKSKIFITVPNGRQALAYLSAAWHDFPSRQLAMVGITGTDGKTTTTNLLYSILQAAQRKVSMISTVNAVIGNQVLDTGLHTTTPDAPAVQHYLAQIVHTGSEICLLEVTSHGLAQHRVTACDFDVAIVTNITHEHLDLHGSLANYWAAKASLFESLANPPLGGLKGGSKGHPKMAVLNCDDASFGYLKEKLAVTGTAWLGYSVAQHPEAALWAEHIIYAADKTRFTVQTSKPYRFLKTDKVSQDFSFEVETALVGHYNVSNCLAAATAALTWFKVTPSAVQQGIANLSGVVGRMERIDEGQPFIALVDFAHTPNALRRALQTARMMVGQSGRVIIVFGCAGLRDIEKRVMMGQVAAELADFTIITAEDPRTENLTNLMAETAQAMIAHGAIEGQTFERVADRGRAIYRAVQLAQPDDVVMALGKGHEQSMCFGTTEYPWDDRQAMRAALRGQPLLSLPTSAR